MESISAVQLTPVPDGPYRVEGELTILGRDGRPAPDRESPVYLCRCGNSADKPFCDGSHVATGWKDGA